MFRKKNLTLQEIDALEEKTKREISQCKAEKESLHKERGELRLRKEEGDETVDHRLKEIRERIPELDETIEGKELFLGTMPAKRNRAKAIEVEALLPVIQKMDADIQPFVDDINKKVEALNLANQKLLDYLKQFDEHATTQSINLKREFISTGVNSINYYATTPGVYSDPKEIPLTIAMMHVVFDKDKFAAWVEKNRSEISKLISRMRDHVIRLKGDDLVPPPISPYCPNCYQLTSAPDKSGKAHCAFCRKTVEPVY